MADKKPTLLVIEDDEGLQAQLKWAYDDFEVVIAGDRDSAIAALRSETPAVVTLDLGLPPDPDGTSEGFAVLDAIMELKPDTKVIVASGHGARESALQAIERGAYDFYQKPVDIDALGLIVRRAYNLHQIESENRRLVAHASDDKTVLGRLITGAPEMVKVARTIERVASTNVSVMLLGASGTGKELLAKGLHDASNRADNPFVAIDCAAILENLLNAVDVASQPRLYVGQAVQIASLEPTLLLREDPHINANIISELARGTRASITAGPALVCDTGENDDTPLRQLSWWRIETDDGTTGWVPGTSYGEPQIVPYHPEDDLMQTACEISTLSTVNIRQGPALSYPTVANRVESGQVLAARAQTGNPDQAWRHWWQLLEGYWIRADTVSEAEACAQLPFIEAP